MAFWRSFQPELSSGSLFSYIDCIKLFPSVHHYDFRGQSIKYEELQRLVTCMPTYKHGSSSVHFIPLILVCVDIPLLFLSMLWSTYTPPFLSFVLFSSGKHHILRISMATSMCLEFVQNVLSIWNIFTSNWTVFTDEHSEQWKKYLFGFWFAVKVTS